MSTTISRRNLVKGAAIGAAALGAAAVTTTAMADEPADSYTYADTIAWDAEYDVVVLGMGFSGMISAMEAADAGANVLLAEKAPDGSAGGNSRVCGQYFAWGSDDEENTLTYYRALAGGHDIPEDLLETIANGVAHMRTTMSEKYGLDASQFLGWRDLDMGLNSSMSPEYPEFPGSEAIIATTAHEQSSDSYIYQYMRSRIVENYADKIDEWFESPGKALIQDPMSKAIIGVQIERKGEMRNVHALNGVCVCTGGFECNEQMKQDYLGVINTGAAGGQYNEGDGIMMCKDIGARLWHMATWEGPYLIAGTIFSLPLVAGASIVVGGNGNRFFNESETHRHGHYYNGNGAWDNLVFPEEMYLIMDATQREEGIASGDINDYVDSILTECHSLAEVAGIVGCEEANLQKTFDEFEMFIDMGEDYKTGRDLARMRKFEGDTYYVASVMPAVLNTQGGPERNAQAETLDDDGNHIPHLYSAGEMGGFTTYMYNGGTNVAECFIMGQLAGANAATPKDPLPAYTLAPKVESNPAHIGDDTDLVAE